MAPNRKIKAPKVFQGTPGAPGTRFGPSSRKQPTSTGTDPGSLSYGIKSNSTKDPVGRMNSLFGTGNRDLRDGQSDLQSKAPRSFCQD